MPSQRPATFPQALLHGMDPGAGLAAGIIWLVIALAASFAAAASIWAGRVARDIVVQQHVRRLALETDQLASDLGQAVNARLRALRAASGSGLSPATFDRLAANDPQLGWIVVVNAAGTVIAGDGTIPIGTQVNDQAWYSMGLKAPWIGELGARRGRVRTPLLGDLAAPLADSDGHVQAVVAAHLSWQWATRDVRRLSTELDPSGSAQTLVLDRTGLVLVGPDELRNRPWVGVLLNGTPPIEPGADSLAAADSAAGNLATPEPSGPPRYELLPSGQTVLVARAAVTIDGMSPDTSWLVQLSEPRQQVYQRANALAARILWISAFLGAATALIGALGARRLTGRLKSLTRSVGAVGRNEIARIEVPKGRDEVAQLGAAFAKILEALGKERSDLLTLSTELERRVAVRTREVERLAEESRYAAIVRERLKIARDLHDTLAHSMMAMLSEVRLLRKLQMHDPAALPEELSRAEEVAHEGLKEARVAIAQMRVNAVRDTGLGPALATAFDRFLDRTGLTGAFEADPGAARFGDERAKTLFRMAEEALRNVERHAMATRVEVTLRMLDDSRLRLRIADDGVGFDSDAPHPDHYGIVGLKEQAQLIGADLHIDSAPDRGTTLTVSLRIAPETL